MAPVVGEHHDVAGAEELVHVLGDLLEPERRRLGIETCRRQLDDAEALLLEPAEQVREQAVGDDGDAPGAGIGAQASSSSSRRRSSAAS
ncbi:MAG: hypothetical protein ABR569_15485 [Gaiellaceae bacterium]